jgi:hypothetical protein
VKIATAYGVMIVSVVIGFVLRGIINLYVYRIAPYHCFAWDGMVAVAVLVALIILPLVTERSSRRKRSLVTLAVLGIVLGASLEDWNPASIVFCAPL